MVMLGFMSLLDTPRIILRHCITKVCCWWIWGSWRTMLPGHRVMWVEWWHWGMRMHSLEWGLTIQWYQSTQLRNWNAFQILESTSRAEPESSCTMLTRYWKWDTTSTAPSLGSRWIDSGLGESTAKVFVLLELMETQAFTTYCQSIQPDLEIIPQISY